MAEEKPYYSFDDPKAAIAEAEKRIQRVGKEGLEKLNFASLGLTEVPESLSQFKQLQSLFLQGNRIEVMPEWFGQFEHLRVLYVWKNPLKVFPKSSGNLKEVVDVALSFCRLTTVPEFLAELPKLSKLALNHNRLTILPDWMGQLSELEELALHNNELAALPDSLRSLTKLRALRLDGNRALGLPQEILGHYLDHSAHPDEDEGPNVWIADKATDILDYYFRTRGGKRPLNEAKLILLGRGEVGKTCLVNRLVHDRFETTKMTRGIAITQWPVMSGKDTVRLHVWDFGGQEIQHATHQFFLTERSLYLVVLNGRAGAEDEDAEYWLKFVKTFGGSSPTIVVLNKFKVQPFQVNRRALQEKYPFIRAFVETDCKPKTKNGIPELKREIDSALAAMEHVRADFPTGWFQIKERLAEMKEPFISFAEYRKICSDLVEKKARAQERLAGILNALGIALNFREDPQLREETVLNPHWITEGVYQIITNKALAERQGELRLADLGRREASVEAVHQLRARGRELASEASAQLDFA